MTESLLDYLTAIVIAVAFFWLFLVEFNLL